VQRSTRMRTLARQGFTPMAKKTPAKPATRFDGVTNDTAAAVIDLDRIVPDPDQPRKEFDAVQLTSLAESIRRDGLFHPIRVRWDEALAKFVIISGERRYLASVKAGLKSILATIVDVALEANVIFEQQMVENLLRSDLSPIDQANGFKRLLDRGKCSYAVLAVKLGIDKATISRAIALLALPETVQAQVDTGALPAATAYELTKLADPDAQIQAADSAVKEKKSRKQVTDEVRLAVPDAGRPSARKAAAAVTVAPDAADASTSKGSTPPKTYYFDDGTSVTIKFKGEAKDTVLAYLQKAVALAKKG
jgi:ParB family chromosome partitioning protein